MTGSANALQASSLLSFNLFSVSDHVTKVARSTFCAPLVFASPYLFWRDAVHNIDMRRKRSWWVAGLRSPIQARLRFAGFFSLLNAGLSFGLSFVFARLSREFIAWGCAQRGGAYSADDLAKVHHIALLSGGFLCGIMHAVLLSTLRIGVHFIETGGKEAAPSNVRWMYALFPVLVSVLGAQAVYGGVFKENLDGGRRTRID